MVPLFIAFRGHVCLFLHSHFLSNDAASPHYPNILGLSGVPASLSVCIPLSGSLCLIIAHLAGPPPNENAARRRAAESAAPTFLVRLEAASACAPKCT